MTNDKKRITSALITFMTLWDLWNLLGPLRYKILLFIYTILRYSHYLGYGDTSAYNKIV